MRPARLLLAAVPLLAQPVIDASNPEDIVLAPNGTIRHVWNRKGIWRTGVSHPTLNAFCVWESRNISLIGIFPFYLEEILVNGK